MAEVCAKFGGDRENEGLTSFSPASHAARLPAVTSVCAMIVWRRCGKASTRASTTMVTVGRERRCRGAIERAARFQGKAVFQTDNSQDRFQPVMDVMKTKVTWAQSSLGFHSTAMFLDDRLSTQQLHE
jgi:hypothetical protein